VGGKWLSVGGEWLADTRDALASKGE
jgi:hypothetical protein